MWLERAAEPAALLDPDAEAPSPVGVANIDYDAKGQRLRIDYKNGASTLYSYDPLTFRLTHCYTRRNAGVPSPTTAITRTATATIAARLAQGSLRLQNLHYTYDPAGNITHIQDDAQQTIYFRNKRVEPSNDYTYDALYRLIQATGREHLGQDGDGDRNPPTAPRCLQRRSTRGSTIPATATPWAPTSSAMSTTPSATSCRCSTAAAIRHIRAGRAPTTTTNPA